MIKRGKEWIRYGEEGSDRAAGGCEIEAETNGEKMVLLLKEKAIK